MAVVLGFTLLILVALTRVVWVNLLIALALMVLLAPAISIMQRNAIHMSPLIVMIGIVVAFEYAGIIGEIVAVPVTASGWVLFNYVYAKIRRNPWPPAAELEDSNAA